MVKDFLQGNCRMSVIKVEKVQNLQVILATRISKYNILSLGNKSDLCSLRLGR